MLPWLLLLGLGSCGPHVTYDPLEWWNQLQGGAIGAQRPPPPGVTDPYPKLGTVPARPKASDPKEQDQVNQSLVFDRSAIEIANAQNPLPPALPPGSTSGGAKPAKPAGATAAADTTQAAAASNDIPVRVPPAPVLAPVGPGAASASLQAANTPAPAPVAATPPPTAAAAAANAALPQLAAAPPSRPQGLAEPQSAVPPPLPQIDPAPLGKPGEYVVLTFLSGAPTLSHSADGQLRHLAALRAGRPIAVVGHGEAASFAPATQQTALVLGLDRAHAMASVLVAAGVPAVQLRVSAEAFGRGGTAALIDPPAKPATKPAGKALTTGGSQITTPAPSAKAGIGSASP